MRLIQILTAISSAIDAPPAVVIPPLTTEQKTTIADVLQYIADTLRSERSLPIINSIKQIKTKIQNNPQILDVTKAELQTELVSLEKQITRLVENLRNIYEYGSGFFGPPQPLQQQLQQLQKLLPQLLQQQLQAALQENRYLPLLSLITTLITTLISRINQ
jgi:predicted Zn-dependent peptidase